MQALSRHGCVADHRRVEKSTEVTHMLHYFNIRVQGRPCICGQPSSMILQGCEDLRFRWRNATSEIMKMDHGDMKDMCEKVQNARCTDKDKQIVGQGPGGCPKCFNLNG